MRFTLRTLTPLWTGGVDQACDRLHETGLIGSLRWWYEALVRGLGGYACDPTDHSCTFDEDKYRKSKASGEHQRLLDAGVCDACQLFGCTGWGRKFRLQISDGRELSQGQNILIPSERVHQSRRGPRAGGWFVFSEGRVGEIVFDPIPLRDADLRPIHTILAVISRHASLGPKGASGYGVFRAENEASDLAWAHDFGSQPPLRNNALPDFRDIFFAKFRFQEPANDPNWWHRIEGIQQAVNGKLKDGSFATLLHKAQDELERIKDQDILPIAPAIRNWLRYKWQHALSSAEEHFIFGEAQAVCPNCCKPGFRPDKKNHDKRNWCPHCNHGFDKGKEIPTTASKIFVSYAYHLDNARWEFRIWGWLPCAGKLADRDEFLKSLHAALEGDELWNFVFPGLGIKPQIAEWHALACGQVDGRAYLNELLGGAP